MRIDKSGWNAFEMRIDKSRRIVAQILALGRIEMEDADIEAKGTGVKVSADDLDVLLADIEKLTREE